MKRIHIILGAMLILTPIMTGCQTTAPREEQMTVAKAQREIKIGMSSADVVEVMGAPNMITTDSQRRETWVYDRVSQQVSRSSAGVWLVVAAAGSQKASSSSRTLTVIVKFDENNMVRDFSYRTSTF